MCSSYFKVGQAIQSVIESHFHAWYLLHSENKTVNVIFDYRYVGCVNDWIADQEITVDLHADNNEEVTCQV